MKKSKETGGKVACNCGNLATATMMFSSKERVIRENQGSDGHLRPGRRVHHGCVHRD
jgi:hypothetical protein